MSSVTCSPKPSPLTFSCTAFASSLSKERSNIHPFSFSLLDTVILGYILGPVSLYALKHLKLKIRLSIWKLWLPRWLSGKEFSCQAGESLSREGPLKGGIATHSSILAWRIPWTEESGGLPSMGSQRVRHV